MSEDSLCSVCNKFTHNCVPSPFGPWSDWRCRACCYRHLVPYKDLMIQFEGHQTYDAALDHFVEWYGDGGRDYAEKYWLPTLKWFDKTKEEAIIDANFQSKSKKHRRIDAPWEIQNVFT